MLGFIVNGFCLRLDAHHAYAHLYERFAREPCNDAQFVACDVHLGFWHLVVPRARGDQIGDGRPCRRPTKYH